MFLIDRIIIHLVETKVENLSTYFARQGNGKKNKLISQCRIEENWNSMLIKWVLVSLTPFTSI